ncbi:hypothetical protein [Gordonibacter massiliensis (ex Traore et al. 2017)]|uniref:Uncharacterized protein n=1 Tax=Gordonibacter massiliensis (ex Traore et al. 2017) TaxID=1841863 RepID=A0A842JHX9_9ACTN|nr:hypothetical protein [Gordonibacter massiliensis (ex Traore et al. 2017)]MBC2889448.1 hypothetical protein [Gordonibacter massiliensis (ex Traore et al. 2017)]
MNAEEGKPLSSKPVAPAVKNGFKRPAPPEPPKPPCSSAKPAAASEGAATSADDAAEAMPDLDQFNFMKW